MSEEQKGVASLGELIETKRFLGRELLTWVWFESEVFEQRFSIEGFGECELFLEKKLDLESPADSDKETTKLTGVAPSGTPEARESLRRGKLPTRARIVIRREEQEFSFVLDADALALSGVKIPALLKGDGDDPFYERMQLIEELEGAVEALYREFLLLRLARTWEEEVVPSIVEWMNDQDGKALERYRQLRQRYGVQVAEQSEPGRVSITRSRVVTKKTAAR
jgi:hypothetical protein